MEAENICKGDYAVKAVKMCPEKALKVWINSLTKCWSCELSGNPSTSFPKYKVAQKYQCSLNYKIRRVAAVSLAGIKARVVLI